jgi:nucleoside-diphosphate-sugar epimerase
LKILVTGASGFVGSVLVPLLLNKYGRKSITLLVMPADPLRKNIETYGVTLREGAIERYDDVLRAVDGHDIVIHLAGLISYWQKDKEKLDKVNVQGVENIVNVCLVSKIAKLIHISSVGAIGFHKKPNILIDEETPFNWPSSFYYMHSKFQGQKIVEEAIRNKGLNAVILNPASIMGPGDPNILTPHNQIYQRIYKHFLFGSFTGGLGVVDVRDLCNVILKAIDRPDCTGAHLIVGENVEYGTVIKTIAACANKRSHVFPVKIPAWIFSLVGMILEFISVLTRKRPLITYAYGRLSGWYTYYSNKKSKEVFSIEYTSFEDTIADTCRYFERTFLRN